MKTLFPGAVCALALASASCGGIFPADNHRLAAEPPPLPQSWTETLGAPHWRLEWFDESGRRRQATVAGHGAAEVRLAGNAASPVLAFPFWPEKDIAAGAFRPAGALFPFDVSGGRIVLSWRGGVDATLFMELARAYAEAAPEGSAAVRLPWNFNWPRFRRLFDDEGTNAEVRTDPWLADWGSIADRTVGSGFDRRRLVPRARSPLELPLGSGQWIGSSPFADPILPAEGSGNPVFPVGAAAEAWASAEGVLRTGAGAWIWVPFCDPASPARQSYSGVSRW